MKKFLSLLAATLVLSACNLPGAGQGAELSIPLKALAQSYSASEDESWEGQLAAEDALMAVEYEIVEAPSKGDVVLDSQTGKFTYVPHANKNGEDSFKYRAFNEIQEGSAKVTVTMSAINDAPVAESASVSGNEDSVIQGQLKATDEENDVLTYLLTQKVENGKLELNGKTGEFKYTPDANYNGRVNFSFKAGDGKALSPETTFYIDIIPVNDTPSADLVVTPATEDQESKVTLGGSDVDGDVLKFEIIKAPKSGKLTPTGTDGKEYTYQPNANFNGKDEFSYVADDGKLKSPEQLVTIEVVAVPDAPVAQNDNAEIFEGEEKSIAVLENDSEVDGEQFYVYRVVSGPSLGTAKVSADFKKIDYKAGIVENQSADSLEYEIIDSTGRKATAKLTLRLKTYKKTYALAMPSTAFNANNVSVVQRENGMGIDGDYAAVGFYRAQRKEVSGEYQIKYLSGRIIAYTFNKTAWVPLQTIESPNVNTNLMSDDGFGDRVVVSGSRIFTASQMKDGAAVHVYELVDGRYALMQSIPVASSNVLLAAADDRLLIANGTNLGLFKHYLGKGYENVDMITANVAIHSLSLSNELIALGTDVRKVSIYYTREGKLLFREMIEAPNLAGANFGHEVSLRNKRLVVSSSESSGWVFILGAKNFESVLTIDLSTTRKEIGSVHVGMMDNDLIVSPNESMPGAQTYQAVYAKRIASQNSYQEREKLSGFGLATSSNRAMLQTIKSPNAATPYGVKITHFSVN